MRYRLRILKLVSMALTSAFFILPTSATANVIGTTKTFFVNESFDLSGRSTLGATLRYASNRGNFYTDDFSWSKLTASQQATLLQNMQNLGTLFDSHMYPVEVGFWGSEPNPGIDGDVKITILFQALDVGNGGYFDTIHNLPRTTGRNSNEREMIFLSLDALGGDFISIFLAHEFQHLISSNQKELLRRISDEIWLNEVRSEYTATVLHQNSPYVGSSIARRVTTFLNNPSDSLTEWANITTDYGIAAVFAEYLAGRFGPRILVDSLQSSFSGIESINNFLARNNFSDRFTDIFMDWMIASYVNDPQSIQYGYSKSELQSIHVRADATPVISNVPVMLNFSLKDWQPVWVDYSVGSAAAIKLELGGDLVKAPAGTAVIYFSDGTYEVARINGNKTYYILSGAARGIDTKIVQRIVFAGTFTQKQSNSSGQNLPGQFLLQTSLISETELAAVKNTLSPSVSFLPSQQSTSDGVLIKRNNAEPETYVIRGKYKRYLRPDIINLYGHLDVTKTIPLDGPLFESYVTANYVRYVNDKKVYAIWPDGTKHWLNISAEQFTNSGRDWNSIFIINEAELNAYTTGADITR